MARSAFQPGSQSQRPEHRRVPPPAAERPLLSLCMIVRDNARTIVPCLESAREWVDEIIVVDTGSIDETPELCRQLGAKVYSFPWIDDFSAARNESLQYATGQWIFWMDSDDTLPPECGRKLRELVGGEHPAHILAYVMQVHCPGPQGIESGEKTVVDHVKLFRNRPELRFEGRIHEQILSAIRRLGGQIGWTDIYVEHSGSEHTPQARQRKYERDLRILQLDLAERPDHPFVLFNLGMTYNDMERHEEAVYWLRRSLAVSGPGESHVRKVYALLVASLTQLGRFDEACAASRAGRLRFPQDAELGFREGILAQTAGRYADAVAAYRTALQNCDQRHFSSVDPGIYSYKARHNLALAYQELKREDLAEFQWQLIRQEQPAFQPALFALGRSLLAQRKVITAASFIERLANTRQVDGNVGLLQAELAECEGREFDAHRQLEALAARYSTHHEVIEARCKFLFHRAQPGEAESALQSMVERFPRDGAAWHNLASIYLAQGRHGEAIAALQQSLAVRPNAEGTRRRLAELVTQEAIMDEVDSTSKLAPVTTTNGQVNRPAAIRDLPACHSRRDFDSSRGLFFCAHPRMHTKNNLVTAPLCRVCRFWAQPPPDDFRPNPTAASPQRDGLCRFLGDLVELRECESCRGQVKLKVFACCHPLHEKTTLAGCETCLEYQPARLPEPTPESFAHAERQMEPDPETVS